MFRKRDKVIFLKPHGETFRIVGRKFVKPTQKRIRFRRNMFNVPDRAEYLNRSGRFTFFVNFKTGKGIHFFKGGSKQPSLDPKEADALLEQGFISGFIKAFGGIVKYDKILIIFALGTGIAIGYGISAVIHAIGA